jgi:predicted Rossmann-fold nucleotide-binding protein
MNIVREIESTAELVRYLDGGGDLEGVVVQEADLRDLADRLTAERLRGAVFLGCRLSPELQVRVERAGALVFPRLPHLPYRPYRSSLYTLEELMQGYRPGVPGSFENDALDSRIYHHAERYRSAERRPILEALAQRLHDHAIDDALQELLLEGEPPRRVVAVMGGHALRRGEPAYRKVARITWSLTRAGYFVATGGGPGAMEAGNLGAWFAPWTLSDLDEAIDLLAEEPDYRKDRYIELGFRVRERFPEGAESLAIPTWFYGHEPTNQFATHIAKYFSNSIREDGLLAIARHGVIYAPGSAGTVQEIFMDATQNHYATFHWISPMVFLDKRFWTEHVPAFPLLQAMARGRPYEQMLHLDDEPEGIVEFILAHPPLEG